MATTRGDPNAVYKETDPKNLKINCKNVGPIDEECLKTIVPSDDGPTDIHCHPHFDIEGAHLRRLHRPKVCEKNVGRCTDHPTALKVSKSKSDGVKTYIETPGLDYRFAESMTDTQKVKQNFDIVHIALGPPAHHEKPLRLITHPRTRAVLMIETLLLLPILVDPPRRLASPLRLITHPRIRAVLIIETLLLSPILLTGKTLISRAILVS